MEAQRTRVLVHGLFAGFAAYLTVVILYALLNLITGRAPFETALALGGALVGPLVPEAGRILAYNGIHLLVMLVLGLVSAWLVRRWEVYPELWYAVFALLTTGMIVLTLVVGMFASEYAGAVHWRSVVLANVAAAGVMAAVLVLSSDLRLET
jgi:hypothetical protein